MKARRDAKLFFVTGTLGPSNESIVLRPTKYPLVLNIGNISLQGYIL